jgi:endonuclease YncB( thermonuclease family)
MKNNHRFIKLLSLVAVLALFSSACLIGGAQPASTLSAQEVLQTSIYETLTALAPSPLLLATQTPVPVRQTAGLADTPIPPVDTLSFTPTPPGTPAPVSLLPSSVVIEGLGCIPTHTRQDLAIVLKVIDGDTIQVIVNGKTVIVSYIGIDAPPLPSGSNPGGRLAQEAFQKNKSLVDGKIVILVKDTTEADASGHLLRYVLTDTLFVNHELVKQGLAAALAVPPDVACRATFESAQQAAMAQLIGLWSPTPSSTPRPNNLPSLTPTFKKSAH